METTYLSDFEALFHRYYSYLAATAFHILNDADLAEDIVQEFYISYWKQQKELPDAKSFRAYAKRAVTNDCIDYLRKQQVVERRSKNLVNQEAHSPEDDAEQLQMEQNRHQRILDLVSQLPKDRQDILLLHAVEKMSYSKIAECQGISINTVKTQLSRAYKALRLQGDLILTYIIRKITC